MLETGLKNTEIITVTPDLTADKVGSGMLAVYATPSMIALMESTCAQSVAPYLPNGITSVGTEINIKHVSADPIGAEIRCESVLLSYDGRNMLFEVKCYDEAGLIGEGTHKRATVKAESFLAKTNAKFDNIQEKSNGK